MKKKLNLYYFLISLWLMLSLTSCFKDVNYTSENEGNVYMPQAVNDRNVLSVNVQSAAQYYTYGAAYGGTKTFDKDLIVMFSIDTSLVASYNEENGTSYLTMPTSSYSLSSLTDTIKAGKSSSSGQTLTILSSNLDIYTKGIKYMLPIKITKVSDGNIDSSYGVTYFKIDTLVKSTVDITSEGTLSVNIENINGSNGADNNEGSNKLVDNNSSTKYLIYNYSSGITFWWQLYFPSAEIVNLYTITSANDGSTRDIKDWEFQASNDGLVWTTLDTEKDQTWDSRLEVKTFSIDNSTAYKYYRVNVLSNNGSTLVQVAEWRLLQYVVN